MKRINEQNKIVKDIISKGGLMGCCAKLYQEDNQMADKFIFECSEQCHTILLVDYFGKELINDIISYTKKYTTKNTILTS